MGQNALEARLSGTVKQDGRRVAADIFPKVVRLYHNGTLSTGMVKPAVALIEVHA
jgi:hypothetical protein